MPTVRRYTGIKLLTVVWTAVAVAIVVAGATELRPQVAAIVPVERFVAAAAGGWVGGLGFFWLRERRTWRGLDAGSRFGYQGGTAGTYPPLHASVDGRTVTAEAVAPRRLGRIRARLRTSVDGVEGPVRVRFRHVTAGGAGEGPILANPTLDERFVVQAPTPDWVESLLSPEVQSTLMDLDVPATVTVTEAAVVLDVPFVRLTAPELGRCADVVASLGNRVEGTHPGLARSR